MKTCVPSALFCLLCALTLRYRTLARGVAVANDSDDVLLLRGGSYNETMTITRALTLRATRGTVVIGTP